MYRCVYGVLLLALLGGCADTASVVRKATYPEGFNYVSKPELRSTMQELWHQIRELDHALAEPVDSADVVQVLDRLRDGAATLEAGPRGSNHPVLQDQLGEFQRQLERARLAALMTPPDYQPALGVVDGCARCHTIHR